MFATRNELEIVADIFATKIFVALPKSFDGGFETEMLGQGNLLFMNLIMFWRNTCFSFFIRTSF